jgi:hypothetical protein
LGFRFRKSVRILPGIRLNFSKSGMSTSIGHPGASINLSSKGTRHTVGLPGTGLSYSALSSKSAAQSPNAVDQAPSITGCGWLLVGAISLFAVTMCSRAPQTAATNEQGNQQAVNSLMSDQSGTPTENTIYVSSRALNGRAAPSKSAEVIGKFREGDALVVQERKGDWTKVAQGAVVYWVASSHVASQRKPRATDQFLHGSTSRQKAPRKAHFAKPQRISDDYCPCRGERVCVGPRGGRYCITSGGNKRYGV